MGTTDGRRRRFDRALDVAVPAALAVLTWFPLVVAVGVIARSGLALLPLAVAGGLLWPVAVFAPWRAGVARRVRTWARKYRHALGATALLAAASLVGGTLPGAVRTVLYLPTAAAAGAVYGPAVFYRRAIDPLAADVVFRGGQWYVRLLWLYVLGAVATTPLRGRADG